VPGKCYSTGPTGPPSLQIQNDDYIVATSVTFDLYEVIMCHNTD